MYTVADPEAGNEICAASFDSDLFHDWWRGGMAPLPLLNPLLVHIRNLISMEWNKSFKNVSMGKRSLTHSKMQRASYQV